MPCSDLQQYCRDILFAVLSPGGAVALVLVICVGFTLGLARMAFLWECLAGVGLEGAAGCFAGRTAGF